ncbi:hypothetical protein B566_EDAN019361 [Ephemera danica]|nr:hypothetical protein B566_EDAN019361 [Ephemera danica]
MQVQVLRFVLEAEKAAEDLLDKDVSLLSRRAAIESAVNTLETLSFMALLCGLYQSLTRPARQSAVGGRKGKKKKDVSQPTQVSPAFYF